MAKTKDNRRIRAKGELINSLVDIRAVARSNRRLFIIKVGEEGKVYGPVFSTALKGFQFKNKINLGAYNMDLSEDDLDKREMVYISLGKSKTSPDQSIYYSFDGDHFEGDELNSPRSPKEVYGFLEDLVGSDPGRRGIVDTLVLNMEKQFYMRFNEALDFEKELKRKKDRGRRARKK